MTPTNTEALAARLESGWCPIESPTDMERAAAELRRLSAVEAENESIREALAAKITTETLLTGAHGKPGEFFIGLQGGAAQLLAEGLAQQFKDSDATNYLELRFTSRFAAVDTDFVVTVQKVSGKTPAMLRAEAEAERDALRADAERLNWLESMTHRGYAPQVVYDDNGHWAVSFDGVMPAPQAGPPDEPLMVSALVEPHEWKKTVRAAIDAASAAMKGTQ